MVNIRLRLGLLACVASRGRFGIVGVDEKAGGATENVSHAGRQMISMRQTTALAAVSRVPTGARIFDAPAAFASTTPHESVAMATIRFLATVSSGRTRARPTQIALKTITGHARASAERAPRRGVGHELLCHMSRGCHRLRSIEVPEDGRDNQPRACDGEVILVGIKRYIAVHVAAFLSFAKDVLGIHEGGVR
jgi:hypothetical protein